MVKPLVPSDPIAAREALRVRHDAPPVWRQYHEAIEQKHRSLVMCRVVTDLDEERGHTCCLGWNAEDVFESLPKAESYYWSKDLTDLVVAAAEQLPEDVEINRHFLTSEVGYFWFAGALPWQGLPEHESLRAIYWHWRTFKSGETSLDITAFTASTKFHVPGPMITQAVTWAEGRSLAWMRAELIDSFENAKHDHRHPPLAPEVKQQRMSNMLFLMKFTAAASLFLRQHLIEAPRTAVDRACRKRIEKLEDEPVVRVVLLRRRARSGDDEQSSSDRTWQHRWFVSGHWRNQFYRSQGVYRPKWILPYVKGPADKALKIPGQKIFAVIR